MIKVIIKGYDYNSDEFHMTPLKEYNFNPYKKNG
jgi:hypothetical protein